MKTVQEVEDEYRKKFGGLPIFLLWGASDEYIIEKLSECINTGKELEPDDEDADY